MELKRITQQEIPKVAELAHQIWWEHYPAIISGEQIQYMLEKMYAEEVLTEQLIDRGFDFFWIQTAEENAGFLVVEKKSPNELFIQKFYIQKKYSGQGLGQKAFEQLVDFSPQIETIRLGVNRKNYTSINFYFKIGFKIEKVLDSPIGNGYAMEDFIMLWNPNFSKKNT